MAGTREGGLAAAKRNLANDPDFYRRIGKIGGKKGTTGGFAANPELARLAGSKGGSISRKGRKLTEAEKKRISNAMKARWAKRRDSKQEQ